ncbi:MAG TPA: FtsQ-type POTRA domain-containing protein [Anaerolineaceae bacterium]|nr:FtsQ-type POTRA domain-containing protein [Anaerolineaceae bacterium]
MASGSNRTTRADEVRARRKIEPVRRKPIPANPSVRVSRDAQNASRVVSRRAYTSTQYTKSAATRNRSRVYMPTGTPGSEVRLPALPQFRFSWRLLSGLIAVGMIVLLFMMGTSTVFAVDEVNLSGGFRVPAEEIAQKLDLQGVSIISVMPSEVENQILEAFPDVKAAEVKVNMPAGIDILIEERIPALLWLKNEEVVYWIDQEGFAFTVRGEATLPIRVYANSEPPHPLGWVAPELTLKEDEAETTEILPLVDPAFVTTVQKLNSIKPAESPMLYDEMNGLGWMDPHGWQVYFGDDDENIDLKLMEYTKIVETILDRNLQPVLISMEFLHAPYYRLEP